MWVQSRGLRNFWELATVFEAYRADAEGLVSKATKDLGVLRVTTERDGAEGLRI